MYVTNVTLLLVANTYLCRLCLHLFFVLNTVFMIEWISQPWHWSVSGIGIVVVMFLLLFAGGEFGVSSNLRAMCSIAGAGTKVKFFDYDWRAQSWNLVFVTGAIVGGWIASTYLSSSVPVAISTDTQTYLSSVGIDTPLILAEGTGYLPSALFDWREMSLPHYLFLIVGGFLVGFGTRYAGGCTSGHAISGLSNLQWPSLVAVIGFFIGGLLMTWVVLPYLLTAINIG